MPRRRVVLVESTRDVAALRELLARVHDVTVADEATAGDLAATAAAVIVAVDLTIPWDLVDRLRGVLPRNALLIAFGDAPAAGWKLAFDYWFHAGDDPRELQMIISAPR